MSKKEKEPLYLSAWNWAKTHYLFSSLVSDYSSSIRLIPLDEGHPEWTKINWSSKAFAFIKVNKSESAIIYINKKSKILNKEEWKVVFATIIVYLGLELFKPSLNNKNSITLQAGFIYALSYVIKNIMSNDYQVPLLWNDYFKYEDELSLQNDSSLNEQLLYDNVLFEKIKNINLFNNAESNWIEFVDEKNYGSILFNGARKSMSDIFISSLLESAKKTISLKSSLEKKQSNNNEDTSSKAYLAKKWIMLHYPLLAGVANHFKIVENAQVCQSLDIKIAAVSALEKIIYVNPLAQLNDLGLRFVLAHEMLHVALNHAGRLRGRDPLMWNLACDFVINHWLIEMSVGISPYGVFLDKNLQGKSADEIYLLISRDVKLRKKMTTLKDLKAGESNSKKSCDMLDTDPSYFSDLTDACKYALLQGMFMHKDLGGSRGNLPADLEEEIYVLNQPPIPWQVELAEWITKNFPNVPKIRTYARPSRRQSATPDIPRASYKKPHIDYKTRTFGVILDTSASMDKKLLAKCLGAIASYSKAQNVEQVRLIYCDAQPYDEGWVNVKDLEQKVKIKGRGGTVLQPAVNYLENALDFPNKAPILVLTDGFFESDLTIQRENAFLVPNKIYMAKRFENVFEFD